MGAPKRKIFGEEVDEHSSSFLFFSSFHVVFADSKLGCRERGKLCFKATRCRTEEGGASSPHTRTQTIMYSMYFYAKCAPLHKCCLECEDVNQISKMNILRCTIFLANQIDS